MFLLILSEFVFRRFFRHLHILFIIKNLEAFVKPPKYLTEIRSPCYLIRFVRCYCDRWIIPSPINWFRMYFYATSRINCNYNSIIDLKFNIINFDLFHIKKGILRSPILSYKFIRLGRLYLQHHPYQLDRCSLQLEFRKSFYWNDHP